MAFRSEKVALGLILVQAFSLYAAELRYDVHKGVLIVDGQGIRVENGRERAWKYSEIQQLTLSEKRLSVLPYTGRKHDFKLLAGTFEDSYFFLKDKLDQRFIAALAAKPAAALWEIPARHLDRIGGTDGTLIITPDQILYRTDKPGDSRTWRYKDIENISSASPFEFTLTSYERSRAHYGGFKAFHFQLKQPLDRQRYDELWRRLTLGDNR